VSSKNHELVRQPNWLVWAYRSRKRRKLQEANGCVWVLRREGLSSTLAIIGVHPGGLSKECASDWKEERYILLLAKSGKERGKSGPLGRNARGKQE
jgi:hypothetical protein